MAVSAIRKWWITHQLDKSDSNDLITEDEGEEDRRRQLCVNLNQALRTTQLLVDFDGGRPILRLTAPLDLVNFASVFHPRWPTECEVISDIINHIEWDPPEPEPFYQPSGHERAPMQAGEERGKVVYCVDHATKRPYFTCSRVRGSRGPIKSATSYDVSQSDFILEFESRFECGNLQKAVQVGVYDYELTLRTDMYTLKHTQWFYFRVRNMKAGVTYRFTIINLKKSSGLYSQGMRPLLYSETAARDRGVGWQRTGSNIRYYRNCNQNPKDTNSDPITLYSLTWTLQFPYDSDTCYLAHCYPYTYSRLHRYLRCISSNPAVASYCKLRVLCNSLAGNPVYVVTITSPGVGRVEGRSRKAVVVTARVHPGETNASWMMEGFLDFLLGNSEDAQLLRDTFVFKVVPMLNPDGVVVGNYRCSLAGRDLNRQYKTVLRDSFPSVWHTRNMVERLTAERDVVLYCDFHGHNRKNNVFIYGCNSRGDVAGMKLHERVFPLMMSKNASNKFSFKSCKFRVQKNKEGTGRIAMWKLGIKNSYTMEATFGGSTLGDRRGTHFSTRDLKSLGFYFCDTLLDYCDPDPTKVTNCLSELGVLMRKKVRERLGKDLSSDCNISVSDLETSTSGSNSSDSDGPPVHLMNQPQTANPESFLSPQKPPKKKKKKRLRSHKERNRLRQERVNNNTQPKVFQSNITNITAVKDKKKQCHKDMNRLRPERENNDTNALQSNITNMEETFKESIQEQPAGSFRKKWQVNGLIRKGVMPHATSLSGELSQVTLWQGCRPVKGDYVENMRAVYMHHRTKSCSHHGSYNPHTDVPVINTQQWRCCTQLLHLSPHLQSSPQSSLQAHQGPRPFLVSRRDHRGLQPSLQSPHRSPPLHIQKIPDINLLSSFTTPKFDSKSLFSERTFFPGDSSHAGVTKTNKQNEEKNENSSEEGLSVSKYGEEIQSDPSPDTHLRDAESHSSLFVPVQRGKDLRGKGLYRGTFRDKSHMGLISPVLKPAGLSQLELPPSQTDTLSKRESNIRHHPSGRHRHISSTQGAADPRSTRSAPPKNQMEILV
ncbi:cytosolic carboxypeptidase 2 isoform X2 [Labrus mixtus]|uniref:cytosolic carboxypeptidase 2 isoform X2 n=1 Tax=Labrus mixtus TaxID=508554 RepID=UPI0029BFAB01|nr:cytosolic carboxypeptidase 2 isoform X2 [Labrus mixtus]